MFAQVREYLENHKKIFYAILIVFAFILLLTIVRTVFLENENKKLEEAETSIYVTELTAKQDSIIAEYKDDVLEVIGILSNNAWIDDSGARNLAFNDKEFTERYNGEENVRSYAICSLEKIDSNQSSLNADNNSRGEYRMTCLLSDEQYVQMSMFLDYQDNSSNSGINGIVLSSKKMFSNCEKYMRTKRAEKLSVSNWDNNINQFIDNKNDELFKILGDHCYNFYPQVDTITWNKKIVTDYEIGAVILTFQIPLKSPKNIDVYYYKQDGRFEITKSKS